MHPWGGGDGGQDRTRRAAAEPRPMGLARNRGGRGATDNFRNGGRARTGLFGAPHGLDSTGTMGMLQRGGGGAQGTRGSTIGRAVGRRLAPWRIVRRWVRAAAVEYSQKGRVGDGASRQNGPWKHPEGGGGGASAEGGGGGGLVCLPRPHARSIGKVR